MKNTKSDLYTLSAYRNPLMGLAALWIYIFHLHYLIFPYATFGVKVETFIKATGVCGVDIFMFLSGLGLCYSMSKNTVIKFYYKRFTRLILPILFTAAARGIFQHWSFNDFICNITGYNFVTKSVYSFLWYVYAVIILYIVFPWIYKIFCRVKNKELFIAGVIALWFIATVLLKGKLRSDIFGFTNRIPVFIVGMYVGYLMQHKNINYGITGVIAIAATLCVGLYIFKSVVFDKLTMIVPLTNSFLPNLITTVSLCMFVAFILGTWESIPVLRIPTSVIVKVLGFFGTISLEFYCVQDFICSFPTFSQDIIDTLPASIQSNYIAINLLVFGFTAVVAWLAHLLINSIMHFSDKKDKTRTKQTD